MHSLRDCYLLRRSRPWAECTRPVAFTELDSTPDHAQVRSHCLKVPVVTTVYGRTHFIFLYISSTAENCPTTPTRTQRRDTDYTPSKKRMTNGPGTPSRAPFRTPMHFSPTRTATSETPLRPGQPLITSLAALAGTNVASNSFYTYDPEKEPIKAFLRIRPNLQQAMEKTPYMEAVSDVEVSMLPPEVCQNVHLSWNGKVVNRPNIFPKDSNAYRTRNRAPERYKFTKIFHEDVSQKQFFDETALPLVEDVLNGENALLFAYGVTNSGKTYSIQGTKNDSGILPRSLDVIFNSIKEYQNDSKVRLRGWLDQMGIP
jgi:hypothetical protein